MTSCFEKGFEKRTGCRTFIRQQCNQDSILRDYHGSKNSDGQEVAGNQVIKTVFSSNVQLLVHLRQQVRDFLGVKLSHYETFEKLHKFAPGCEL